MCSVNDESNASLLASLLFETVDECECECDEGAVKTEQHEDGDIKDGDIKSETLLNHTYPKDKASFSEVDSAYSNEFSRFVNTGYMERHGILKSGERRFECDICECGFSTKRHLERHNNTFHNDEHPFNCTICGTRLTRKYIMLKMQTTATTHSGERSFKCDTCEAAMNNLNGLEVQNKSHIDLKPLKCSTCGAGFNRKSVLIIHSRIHTGEKPFKCDICDARFTQKGTLKTHKKTHSKVKNRIQLHCGICGQEFNLKPQFIEHARIHSCKKQFKCDICDARFNHEESWKVHNTTQ